VGQAASFEEKDAYPSAVEYLLGALAASLATGLATEASRDGLELDDIELATRGALDNVLAILGLVGVEELRFVKTLTDKPVKITLPGPYLLTRAMWVGDFSGQAYGDKTEMADDVVKVLREELLDLKAAGCEFVQFDEPVLTEIVMSEENDRRTFM
jgi:hypothetical protein